MSSALVIFVNHFQRQTLRLYNYENCKNQTRHFQGCLKFCGSGPSCTTAHPPFSLSVQLCSDLVNLHGVSSSACRVDQFRSAVLALSKEHFCSKIQAEFWLFLIISATFLTNIRYNAGLFSIGFQSGRHLESLQKSVKIKRISAGSKSKLVLNPS